MQVSISTAGFPSLHSALVNPGELHPVINGRLIQTRPELIERNANHLQATYTVNQPDCARFVVTIEQVSPSECALQYTVIGIESGVQLLRFGVQFNRIEKMRQYLCHGWHSWDGSIFVDPAAMSEWAADIPRPETSHAMTLLLPRAGSGSLVLGFERHDQCLQTFTFDTHQDPPSLRVETVWDDRSRDGAEGCSSQRLLVIEHGGVEGALREWAQRVAVAAPTPPRSIAPINGWCSWYNLYNYATEENLLQHLKGLTEVCQREHLPMQIFQVDDSFTPEMGDWLEIKPQFPRGMKALLDDIRSAGFTPGLWIAPFLVGNRSHLYAAHPDWVLRDHRSGAPVAQMKFYGEFRWGKRSEEYYILDASHPQALDYLQLVFRTWRQDWDCEYFKTDFMFFGAAYGPEQVQFHTPGLTRIEVWLLAARMIRAEIGDAIWTGCGCPLWPAVGLVDAMRIGRDVGVEWSGNQSAQSLLRDQATRNFFNDIFWQNDPDCVLLRERFHNLSELELQSLALFAGMSGGLMMTSDALNELSPRRLALWKFLLDPHRKRCSYPLLGQADVASRTTSGKSPHELYLLDPVIVQVSSGQINKVFVFNTGDVSARRSYTLDDLGIQGQLFINDWLFGTIGSEPQQTLDVALEPHQGKLFLLQAEPFTRVPG